MNDKFNELWAQAVDAVMPETYTSPSWAQLEKIKLKFGELIVLECMRVCDVADVSLSENNCVYQACGAIITKDLIIEHFGISE